MRVENANSLQTSYMHGPNCLVSTHTARHRARLDVAVNVAPVRQRQTRYGAEVAFHVVDTWHL